MPTTVETKPFKTYQEQLELLKSRGLIVANDAIAIEYLKKLNYYRLSAYSLTLRKDDVFYPNVAFDDIVALYNFDVDFRKVIYSFSHYVETSARAYLAYHHAQIYGPLGYLNNQNFENEIWHAELLKKLFLKLKYSSEPFVIHYREDKKKVYPIWVAIEEMDFGALSKFYKNLLKKDRKAIAQHFYGISAEYLETYLQCASVARNIAAHGGRFYNRINLSPTPKLPPKLKKNGVENTKPFAYVFSIYALLPDDRKNEMIRELNRIFNKHPFAQPLRLGFPEAWETLLESF